jgi:hypothetical protein
MRSFFVSAGLSSVAVLFVVAACTDTVQTPQDLRGDAGLPPAPDAGDAALTGQCPEPLTNFKALYAPPAPAAAGKCTDPAIAAIAAACYGAQKSGKACDDAKAANPTCASCIFYNETAAAWGPVVTFPSYGGAVTLNWAGCVALLDGQSGPTSCAAAANGYALCPDARCASCTGAARASCISGSFADGTPCKPFEKVLTDCLSSESVPKADLEAKCGLTDPSLNGEEWLKRLAKTFCG